MKKLFSDFLTFTTGGSQIEKSAKKSEKELDTSYGNMGFPVFKKRWQNLTLKVHFQCEEAYLNLSDFFIN